MICPACTAAETHPATGLVVDGCRGCAVRSASNAPPHRQEAYFTRMRDDARRAAFRADVEAETLRRRAALTRRSEP